MKILHTNLQRFSIRDGPGIRTTVFLKGCNLNCRWCHNPETIDQKRELQYFETKCLHCGLCKTVCPENCFFPEGGVDRTANCIFCGRCVEICPAKALSIAGYEVEVEALVQELLRDRIFFESSGGGVTLSGGEPLLQAGSTELLKLLHQTGVHTVLDSAFNIKWERIEETLPWTSLYLVDIKAIDDDVHRQWTGCSNVQILENIAKLSEKNSNIWIRVPAIPGANLSQLPKIAEFLKTLPQQNLGVEVIPFHNFAAGKYRSLGLEYQFEKTMPLSDLEIERLKEPFRSLRLVDYNRPDNYF